MIIHKKLYKCDEVKAASRFELHTFPIEFRLDFGIFGAVKVASKALTKVTIQKPSQN